MSKLQDQPPDLFSAAEIAQVAGVATAEVRARLHSGEIASVDGRFVTVAAAVRAVRRLRGMRTSLGERALFAPAQRSARHPLGPLAASGALHVGALVLALVMASLNLSSAARDETTPPSNIRMVFLALPGPGGGGGGGGLRQPTPAPRAELKGTHTLRSPIPTPRPRSSQRAEARATPPPPVLPRPSEQPTPPPPAAQAQPMPQVVAPVASAPADASDRAGTMTDSASATASNGPGIGGGAGTGQGTGLGEGDGSGIGPGSGGGTGGGPYRPGSGVTPPELLREVKPDYTDEARRRGLTGEVLLEIVVKRDGSVGDVRVLQGLGGGLDDRAVAAVRQWQFAPAHRLGAAVDVMVEVAVEFRFR